MTPFPGRRVLDDLLFLLVVPLCLLETDHDALRLAPALVVLVASLLQSFPAVAARLRAHDRLVLPALVALAALGWALTLVLAVTGRPAVLDVTSPVEYLLAVAMVVQVVLTGRTLAAAAIQGERAPRAAAPVDATWPR
ncbi:hypothetical protein [Georgenia thermotolerans]|uniref:Uncharacterized protein n=1 Tax=Georgenia thermotolerans TaxID=527326 RepID=A0A7J5UQB0_9MICO|nr:hypothetical protein [Georgenia thermotolerans]KAE8764143.1 hypothetical protein GB883_10530 [Georgenia thermotolerans]